MTNNHQECCVAPEGRMLKRAFWTLGAVLLVAGAFGLYDRLVHGHINANYGSIVPWGLWVATYIYFIGLSAGAFMISSLVYVFNIHRFERIGRLAVFTALLTFLLALLSISLDIGHMGRAWHVLAYPNFKSPMAWMIWLYLAYTVILLGEMWFLLWHDLATGSSQPGWRGRLYRLLSLGSRDTSEKCAARDRKVVRVLATIGVPVAIMFNGGVGALFGVVAARPHWHSGLFPILFLLSALVSGGSLLKLMAAIFRDGWTRNRETVPGARAVGAGIVVAGHPVSVFGVPDRFWRRDPGRNRWNKTGDQRALLVGVLGLADRGWHLGAGIAAGVADAA